MVMSLVVIKPRQYDIVYMYMYNISLIDLIVHGIIPVAIARLCAM